MRALRLSTTLVLLAFAALVAAASFLLAAEVDRKPVIEPQGDSRGLRGCGYVPGTTCGPVPAPEWSTTGARICADVAGVLLVGAAGAWLRTRTEWRPR